METLLIKNGFVVDVINKENSKVQDIYIKNGIIYQISKNIKKTANKTIDATGTVIMPGLINTHNHSAMTLFRGYADDSELMDWLENRIWPAEEKLTGEDVYYGTKLACIEMIKSGTTMFNDMYFFTEDSAKAVKETGIRAMLGRCIMAVENDDDERIKEAIDIIKKYKNDEFIFPCVAPHAPYTCNDKAIKMSVDIAKRYNVPFHIHLAETKEEVEIIKKRNNVTPTEYLNSLNVFDTHTILAHCVWLTDNDINILKKSCANANISHNPISNSKLGSGIARITDIIKEGINVSLGTDGAGSTNNLDMFEEMKICAYMQKAKNLSASCIDAYKIIQMATINGAKTLGVDDKFGSIETNKKADLIIIDTENIKFKPENDIFSNLVYVSNGNDIKYTIINGKVIYENGKVKNINEKEIKEKCKKISKRLL